MEQKNTEAYIEAIEKVLKAFLFKKYDDRNAAIARKLSESEQSKNLYQRYILRKRSQRILKQITTKLRFSTKIRKLAPPVVKISIAASLLVLISTGIWLAKVNNQFLHNNQGNNSIDLAINSKTWYISGDSVRKIELSDNSSIILNRGTSLYIIEDIFNKNNREVWLEEGEAYFDVHPDKSRPFIVFAGNLKQL